MVFKHSDGVIPYISANMQDSLAKLREIKWTWMKPSHELPPTTYIIYNGFRFSTRLYAEYIGQVVIISNINKFGCKNDLEPILV